METIMAGILAVTGLTVEMAIIMSLYVHIQALASDILTD